MGVYIKGTITKQMHLLMKTRPNDCPLFELKDWRDA